MLLDGKTGYKASHAGSAKRRLSLEKTISDANNGDQHHAIEENIQPLGFKAMIGGWGFHSLILYSYD